MEPQASVDVWVLNTLQCMLLFDFEHKKTTGINRSSAIYSHLDVMSFNCLRSNIL